MLFQTLPFFGFFAIVMALYAATIRHLTAQNLLVMVASYVFYAFWDLRFLSLIVVATAVAFVAGAGASGALIGRRQRDHALIFLGIGSAISLAPDLPQTWPYLLGCAALVAAIWIFVAVVDSMAPERRQRVSVITGVVFNLALLAVFKYFNFFAESLDNAARGLGVELGEVTLKIVLPVGISFFTFQKLAYIIDVKRGEVEASRNLIRFGAFVAFFPQLVAGPIERAGNLLRQFDNQRVLTRENFGSGAALFLWGMYKKVVVADNLSPIAARVFAAPESMTSGELVVGLLAFTFQIFCDFSGYSDMARGLARIMGLNLMVNFNIPYVSRTPSEFWDRWHISLSSWLRDYLYIPLGGNRGGVGLTYRNLFLTMLLGGLWHGASWTFVAWGAFHGGILIVYRVLRVDRWLKLNPWPGTAGLLRDVAMIAVMFVLTVFGWLLFRAVDLATVGQFIRRIAAGDRWTTAPWAMLGYYLAPLLLVQAYQLWRRELEVLPRLPRLVQVNAVLFLVCSLVFLAPRTPSAFIYFDF